MMPGHIIHTSFVMFVRHIDSPATVGTLVTAGIAPMAVNQFSLAHLGGLAWDVYWLCMLPIGLTALGAWLYKWLPAIRCAFERVRNFRL